MEKSFTMEPLVFCDYIVPKGHLTATNECHALFYYYLCANKALRQEMEDFRLEPQDTPSKVNYKQLTLSIANIYDVSPIHMHNCWPEVDAQCDLLGLPRLPITGDARMSNVIQLIN